MKKNFKAFTLLEVMIAVLILTVSLWSIYTISSWTKKMITKSEYSVTAMYLAQEWLEFVRNIRDERISNSFNRENWWDKFLIEDLWYWWIWSWWYLIKKIENLNNWEYKIVDSKIDFEKSISSTDDICSDVWIYENCIYEHINLSEEWNQEETNLWNVFFRKIKIEKDFWEDNIIKIYSEIFWEEYWEIQNFILEQKLWNIAIN